METELRAAVLAWLRADLNLSNHLNAIEEESPSRATVPWLGIAATASLDWSTKDRAGREIRIALELQTRENETDASGDLVTLIEKRLQALPQHNSGFELVTAHFLRARTERRERNMRAFLLEYRFRILETPVETSE